MLTYADVCSYTTLTYADVCSYTTLTYADVCVQEATIPLLLSNKDAVVQAPTGTIFLKKNACFRRARLRARLRSPPTT
jgi:hypothetical protein